MWITFLVSGSDDSLVASLVDKGVIEVLVSVFVEKSDKDVKVCL